jgi:hypothetical protein
MHANARLSTAPGGVDSDIAVIAPNQARLSRLSVH